MGDSCPPQLRAPAPGAAAPSPGGRATPIPRLRPRPQIVTVRPLPSRRDSSRTSHVQELAYPARHSHNGTYQDLFFIDQEGHQLLRAVRCREEFSEIIKRTPLSEAAQQASADDAK